MNFDFEILRVGCINPAMVWSSSPSEKIIISIISMMKDKGALGNLFTVISLNCGTPLQIIINKFQYQEMLVE